MPCLVVKLNRNYGQHTATAVGMSFCNSSFCITMDDDLQHDPFDIPKLIEEMNRSKSDLVYGKFKIKKHNLIRNWGSHLIKKALLNDKSAYEDVTSFRLIGFSIIQQFSELKSSVGFLDEILLSSSHKVSSVLVQHCKANKQKSRYSNKNLIKLAFRIILFHSSFPLKAIIRIGLLSAILFFSIGCFFVYNRFVNEVPLGFSAIIVSIFFSSGLILVALGIIAEYLRKLWELQQGVKQSLIEEICQPTISIESD
jgi:glycosyltransferase involved in cell wall biosynthesis